MDFLFRFFLKSLLKLKVLRAQLFISRALDLIFYWNFFSDILNETKNLDLLLLVDHFQSPHYVFIIFSNQNGDHNDFTELQQLLVVWILYEFSDVEFEVEFLEAVV